jgi:hypothetical protein
MVDRAYVVRGSYPEVLLDAWDEFEDQRGSDSVRPGKSPHLRSICVACFSY